MFTTTTTTIIIIVILNFIVILINLVIMIMIIIFFNFVKLLSLWKVWTQESFQKVEFDRPGERSPE